ncbi:MAG: capsular polysaccharide biosynthesis protein CapF [Lachnospiraceae bacterium]|nr:capsular polysaccharide biosynthesis protein CapF [Lachnospiraceae bacterium]
MKISVIGKDDFIKKNFLENLQAISDGRNRSRAELSISSVSGCEGGDTRIILPSEKEDLLRVESGGRELLSYPTPMIVGKWDDSGSFMQRLCEAAADKKDYPAYSSGEVLELMFVEDLIEEVLDVLEGKQAEPTVSGPKTYKVTVDSVIEALESFSSLNSTLFIREMPRGSFSYKLYSLYLSFLPEKRMSYPVKMNTDNRGVFSELIKTGSCGQVSVNIAKPGVTRGQHWHNTKWEIFIVVSGHGLIKLRRIGSDRVHSFEVRGEDMRAVIMLPGYTHSITNLESDRDLVTVMFANEQFDSERPDTFYEEV